MLSFMPNMHLFVVFLAHPRVSLAHVTAKSLVLGEGPWTILAFDPIRWWAFKSKSLIGVWGRCTFSDKRSILTLWIRHLRSWLYSFNKINDLISCNIDRLWFFEINGHVYFILIYQCFLNGIYQCQVEKFVVYLHFL